METLKKQIITSIIDYELDWANGRIAISKLRADLDAVEKLGATYIEINSIESYGNAYVDINAYIIRIETDEEFDEKVKRITIREEQQKCRDIEEFEMLKHKLSN
jgi:hypothetical protein